MLIRSQRKGTLIHISACEQIYISNEEYDNLKFCEVRAGYNSGHIVLGTYNTVERAIEVLDEIVGCYSIHKAIDAGKRVSLGEMQRYSDMKFGCYNMPQE